jgi:iron complex transport system permease protein
MSVSAATEPPRVRRAVARRTGLVLALAVLGLAALLSLAVGARAIPPADVIDALLHGGDSEDAAIVRDIRVPRTLLGVVVGGALGLAGALMQAVTRNPLADPGLLGVNAGASAAVVIGLSLGIVGVAGSVWFALVGAALAAVAVYSIGSAGRGGANPVRLALAGTAVSAALTAVIYGVALSDERLLQKFNFWSVGALSGRGRTELDAILPFVALGALIAVVLARPLNALALGDESARALGTRVGWTRVGGAGAITLLCGAATAAAGPMYFLGLTVPHVGRALCGPDQRWVFAYSAVLGAALLLLADVLGRVLVRPSELQAGVVVAVIGTPVFISLVRRKRIPAL